ncbi:MAG: protein-glutamate O-methyltransferase CheR [Deltaproteobacteria bacterium]|nr:protein-glutamate O-methyltransferase CheR [Deltaproteobacteria bacterium]
MIKVTPDELKLMAQLIYEYCGVVVGPDKSYLIESRLSPLAEQLCCKSYREFYNMARSERDGQIRVQIIDRITTGETQFFRDKQLFEALRFKIIPDMIDFRMSNKVVDRNISVWSAACSSGQEPYSLAITFLETIPDIAKWNLKIMASDISDEAFRKASLGRYTRLEVSRGLTEAQLAKYFTPKDQCWQVNDRIRAMVSFRKINLLEPFCGIGRFDMIFCRNVAIYFNRETKIKLFDSLANALNRQGHFFLGSSESLADISTRYKMRNHLRCIYYELIS